MNKKRIVLVDDHDMVREGFKIALQNTDKYEIIGEASDGKEAIELYRMAVEDETPFDLICLDIMMPEMNGHEALKEIRKIEADTGIKFKDRTVIFMMTALDSPKDVFAAFNVGDCSEYIVKPINRKKLINLLKEYKLLTD